MGKDAITVTREEYGEAIKKEISRIFNDPDYSESLHGSMMIAMAGSAFAMAVWGHLTGEIENE